MTFDRFVSYLPGTLLEAHTLTAQENIRPETKDVLSQPQVDVQLAAASRTWNPNLHLPSVVHMCNIHPSGEQ